MSTYTALAMGAERADMDIINKYHDYFIDLLFFIRFCIKTISRHV